MAVQQNRKSRSRRDMRRSHDRITINAVAVDATTDIKHISQHATKVCIYRDRQLFKVTNFAE